MTYYLMQTDAPVDGGLFVRELTFDECERLNIDGTLRDQPIGFRARILGSVIAEYYDGEIVHIAFTPCAGDAGFFGAGVEIIELGTDTTGAEALAVIANDDVDGPFWRAVQKHQEKTNGTIFWEE